MQGPIFEGVWILIPYNSVLFKQTDRSPGFRTVVVLSNLSKKIKNNHLSTWDQKGNSDLP